MKIIEQFIKFSKNRKDYHRRKLKELETKAPHSKFISNHKRYADTHESIQEWFVKFKENPYSIIQSENDLFSINPLDLEDLDQEIVDELSLTEGDIFDAQIKQLLQIADRPLDLNELIIGSFRKFNTKHKRAQLTARIHKLVSKGVIDVEGKGIYKLSEDSQNAVLDSSLDGIN